MTLEPCFLGLVPNRMRGLCFACAGLMLGLLAAGCTRQVKAEFPRPPATAEIPPSDESEPEPEPPAEVVVDREPGELDPEPEPAPTIVEPEPAPPQPAPPPVAAEPSGPEPEPPSTHLAVPDEAGAVDPEVSSKLERAALLLSSVGGRELSQSQREQVAAARGFVAQASRALDEGDERRALVLVDKAIILAEDVERTSRP